jgi:hypothetical protein
MDHARRSQTELVVRHVLDEWKPYAWGSRTAQDVDLTAQARAVAAELDHIETAGDVAAIVAAIFSGCYPECHERFTRYTCTSVGARLFRELHAARLLPSQLT